MANEGKWKPSEQAVLRVNRPNPGIETFPASFGRAKMFSCGMVPCVIFEDEHLLAVNKPAGWNTHAPSPYAGEGIYDWLKNREPRWAALAIIQRLDKETSGVMVFGKTPQANRSLTEQFTERRVRKRYLLLTDRPGPQKRIHRPQHFVRTGEKYASRPGGEPAETRFTPILDSKFVVKNAGLKMVCRRTAHGPHTSNSGSRGGKRVCDSRRHALWRHGVVAGFSSCHGNCLCSSGHERARAAFGPGEL